jgi:hypothetical protein
LLSLLRGTNTYKFIGFGHIHGPKPYKFTGFGHIHGPKPYKFIGFGDLHGPKPYKFIRFGGPWTVQAANMSTPIDQEQITVVKTGKLVKPAPKRKPVQKARLKNKPTGLAHKIKKTVERNKAKPKVVVQAASASAAAIRGTGIWTGAGSNYDKYLAPAKKIVKKPPRGQPS